MYLESKVHIKISEPEFIEDETLVFEHEGNIQITGHQITFSNIEFDSQFIFYGQGLDCIKDKKYSTEYETIYKVKAIYKDGTPQNYKIEEITGFTFNNCKFTSDVKFQLSDNFVLEIDNCIFERAFTIDNISNIVYQQEQYREIKICFRFENSIFEDEFLLEQFIIDDFMMKDVELKGDFKLFNTVFESENILFNNLTSYKSFILEKIKFKNFVQFKYAVFKGYMLFRDVKFEEGLDLDYANVEKEINFYNLEIGNTSKISKETFRIIKNQFEKIGNKIEANKYHSLELGKYKEEIERDKTKNWKEYFVFQAHWLSSEHSTNWFRAFWLIGLSSLLTTTFLNFELIAKLFFHPNLFKPEYICKVWNEFWQYAYILNKDKKLLASPLILLFNKMSLSYLYYQFLMSVRKNTSIK